MQNIKGRGSCDSCSPWILTLTWCNNVRRDPYISAKTQKDPYIWLSFVSLLCQFSPFYFFVEILAQHLLKALDWFTDSTPIGGTICMCYGCCPYDKYPLFILLDMLAKGLKGLGFAFLWTIFTLFCKCWNRKTYFARLICLKS